MTPTASTMTLKYERRADMKLYHASWTYAKRTRNGFIKAEDEEQALEILISKTQAYTYGHRIVGEVSEHMISPQSLCINFPNTVDYY